MRNVLVGDFEASGGVFEMPSRVQDSRYPDMPLPMPMIRIKTCKNG